MSASCRVIASGIVVEIINWGQLPVPVVEHRLSLGDRPYDSEHRIVPPHASLVIPRIGNIHLVQDFGVGLQRTESVRKSGRDKQLPPILGAQINPKVPSKRGGVAANIHGYVVD
jgi:hypothetical protein